MTAETAADESPASGTAGLVVREISISSEKFRELPEPEQVFLIQTMRLLNEVNILHRYFIYANNGLDAERSSSGRTAQRVQGMFLLTILAGKLSEGWQMLQTSYFSAGLSRDHNPKLGECAKKALNKLKAYFSKSNPIHAVRNQHAFHFDGESIRKALADRAEHGGRLSFLIAPNLGNCLYVFAQDVATSAILDCFPQKTRQESMNQLWDDVGRISPEFQIFAGEVLMLMCQKVGYQSSEVVLADVPKLNDVRIPFFVR